MKKNCLYILLGTLLISCSDKTEQKNDTTLFTNCFLQYDNNKNGETDSLIACLHKTDSLNEKIKDERLSWLSEHIKGSMFSRLTEYDKSIYYFKNAQLAIHQAKKYDTLIAKSEIGIALVYKNLAKYPEAIQSNLKALSIFEKYKSNLAINKAKTNIANIYVLKGELSEAKQNLKQIISNEYSENTAIPLHALANLYGESGKLDSALMIDDKMISFLNNTQNKLLLSPFYNNKALCYLMKGETDSSFYYLSKSFCIDSLRGDKKNMGVNLVSIGDVYAEQGNRDRALNYYNKAYTIFKTYNIKRELQTYYNQLNAFYKHENNFKMAMLYKDSAHTLANEIDNLTLNSKIELLKIEYDTQKKDTLIDTQSQKIRAQQVIVLMSFLFLLLVVLTTYFIYKNKKAKQKYSQQELLNDTAFETEQTERARIARDLHDSVGQKLSVVKMQLSMKDADVNSSCKLLDEAIQDVRNVSHNLMPADLSKGLINALENMCDQINFSSTSLKIHLNKTEAINHLNLDKQHTLLIYRMVQELVNNAIKYAQAQNIHINMDCEKNQLKLNLIDDGIGFDINSLEKKYGLGIKSIKERVQQLIGTIQLSSNIGKGTEFNISIPYE